MSNIAKVLICQDVHVCVCICIYIYIYLFIYFSVKKVTTDDVYDVISPEEVSESRLYPISSPK